MSILEFPRPTLEAKKAVLLTRVSSKEQEEGYSIDGQRHRLQGYCERRELEVIKIFEITESSTKGDREKFKKMIAFVKTLREPIAIVADKVDRVQRSFKEYPMLDDLIKEGRIELHFVTENQIMHKGSASQERLIWGFHVIMAQAYTDSLRDNVRRSFDQKIRQGEYPTIAPVGYRNVRDETGKSNIIADPERAPLIRRLFEEYARGTYTIKELTVMAKGWDLRGKGRANKALTKSHIHRIVANPFYYGQMKVKGQIYPHRYEPLIDKRLFDECQAVRLGLNRPHFKYGDKEFVFRGVLTCANTGRMISADTKHKTYLNGLTAHWTYLKGGTKAGKPVFVREDKIVAEVQQILDRMRIPESTMQGIVTHLRSISGSERDFLRRQTDELKKEHGRIQERVDALIDMLMDKKISQDDYDRRREKMRERQGEIERLLAGHRGGDDKFNDSMRLLLNLCSSAGDLFRGSKTEEKRQLLNDLFSNLSLDGVSLCYSLREPFSEMEKCAESEKWSALVDKFRTCPTMRQNVIDFAVRCKAA